MRIVGIILCLMLIGGFCYATDTGQADWGNDHVGPGIDPYLRHTHEIDDEYGAGLDLIVYQNKEKTVAGRLEYRYDYEGDGHKAYAVMEVNVWDIFKGE